MSMFAKICITLNLLLTAILIFLMATLLTQKADYKARYLAVFKEAKSAGEDLKRKSEDYDARIHHAQRTVTSKRRNRADLERLDKEDKQVLKEQSATLSKLRTEVSGLDSRWTALQTRYKNLLQRRTELQKQTKQAREERDKAVAQRRDLKNNRSSVDSEILKLQEKVNDLTKLVIERGARTQELQLLVEMIKERYPDLDIPVQIPLIDGKVKSLSGGDLITLTVGRDDGVELGYPFTVVRGKTYIGRVVVRKVYKETCIARIDKSMLAPGRKIRAGDVVTTRIK